MPLITPAHIIALADKTTAAYAALAGTTASGFGAGDGTYGTSLKMSDIRALVEGSANSIFADADLQSALVTSAISLKASAFTDALFGNLYSGFVSLLDSVCGRAVSVNSSISNLDSFMSWYNYGNASVYWQCLAPPDWYYAFGAVKNATRPTPKNCYYEIKQGATYRGTTFTNAVGKWVVSGAGTGALTVGTPAPATHAGGFAWMIWSGATGSGIITVVGTDQDGNAETWTGTLSGASSAGLQLTPQNRSYSLLRSVTSIAAAAGVTVGTIYVESRAPSGRTNPPV